MGKTNCASQQVVSQQGRDELPSFTFIVYPADHNEEEKVRKCSFLTGC